MSKEKFLRLYTVLSILIGGYLFLTMWFFVDKLPDLFYGVIDKNIFNITFGNFEPHIEVFNMPLVIYVSVLVINVGLIFTIGKTDDIEYKNLREVVKMNALLSALLVVGQIVFYLSIPDKVNGVIESNFLFVYITEMSDIITRVVNTNYIISLGYILYNIFVLISSIPKDFFITEDDEELYEDRVINELNAESEKVK